MKTCSKCNEVKYYEFFSKSKNTKDGYNYKCKKCVNEYYNINKNYHTQYAKKYREENKESIKKYREENKQKIKKYHNTWYAKNIEYLKKYREENKERLQKYRKKYREENIIKIREKENTYKKEYIKNKRLNNSLYKLRCNISCLIRNSIIKQDYSKNSRTYQILGCTFEEFKQHLQNQFTKGMTWENQGKWHLDHIYPVSLAKDEEELIRLNHYTNFQPLWAKDNLIKSNKIINNTQLKLI